MSGREEYERRQELRDQIFGDEHAEMSDERRFESEADRRTRWREEIRGDCDAKWKDVWGSTEKDVAELESAVTSSCMLERTLMADATEEPKVGRSRSDDVVMEERLRQMGDDSVAHLRRLEESGPELERLLDTISLFRLPSSGTEFAAVSGVRSAVADFLDVGDA